MTSRIGARDLLDVVVDPGSWRSWDSEPLPPPVLSAAYAADLAAARAKTGLDESVLSGEATIGGRRVAIVACEFAFLAGSIGVAAAERLVVAVERATAERLPLVASPTSGGTRMQEGTIAFLQMVTISAAVARHKQAGLPYLVYLRDPTTGGVFASWGSLGHVTAAQPGALVGFLGPRVFSAIYGQDFPAGVQVAENLYRHGLLDAVVPPEQLAEVAARALDVLLAPGETYRPARHPACQPARPSASATAAEQTEEVPDLPAWDSITRTRRPDRPGVRELLRRGANDVTPLHGTGEGENEPGLILALARFGSAPCILLGQDRRFASRRHPLGPAGLRAARRGLRLAGELNLPMVTVVDTAGAALSREAEEGGLAGEIARCLAEFVLVGAPTVCLLLGQGAGGGALALLPADRVLCAQHAWLSPLPPEGASAILYRTVDRAAEIAAAQGVRSRDLRNAGIVDRIIPERPDAADEPLEFLQRLSGVLESEINALLAADATQRRADRLRRYRRLGRPS